MNEREFLLQLQERAGEQEKLMRGMLLPKVFLSVSLWLGDHPLRLIIPIAIALTLIFHNMIGQNYDNFILKIFGKL